MEKNKTKKQSFQIKFSGLGWLAGEFKKKRKRHSGVRTSKTYNNKLIKLQAKYRKLCKSSKGFLERYPTFEKFLEKNPLKYPKQREVSYRPTVSRTEVKKKSIWER